MALMKAATQSETLWNYDPNLAVDGDSNTCSFTPQSDVQRWWQVSHGSNYFILGQKCQTIMAKIALIGYIGIMTQTWPLVGTQTLVPLRRNLMSKDGGR